MLGRLFFGFMAAVIVLLGYELYSLQTKKSAPFDTTQEKIYAPEGADLSVVEFVDYSCPDCKALHPVFMEAVRQDGKVRVIPRPIMSVNEDARSAAYLVEAAAKQGKYIDLHNYFLQTLPSLNSKEDVIALAQSQGLDGEKLYNDLQRPGIIDEIQKNHQMIMGLNLKATPSFLIGPKMAISPETTTTVDDFKNWFNQARAQ